MDHINPTMDQVDLCLVVGANDVVNPVARTDPESPIAGEGQMIAMANAIVSCHAVMSTAIRSVCEKDSSPVTD